jgi:hypothetical protein
MSTSLSELVRRWDLADLKATNGDLYNQIHERLIFLQRHLYDQYVPTMGPEHPDYETRLERWLDNIGDEDGKRLLFEFAPNITFFTKEDMIKLHQAAFRGPIVRWLIDLLGLALDAPDLDTKLQEELNSHTWYCPITDSMQIGEFHHANNVGGIDYRPDWRSLAKFGDPTKINDFMMAHQVGGLPKPLRRIVLLEDFIGSGTQMLVPDLAAFISNLPGPPPVLLVPLIICPEGAAHARALAKKYSWFKFAPVLEITLDQCITPKNPAKPMGLAAAVYDFAIRSYPLVAGDRKQAPLPYSPFGFQDTGAQVVLYSNTPANTLPLIHHHSNTWNPLFRRSARIK